MAASDWSVRGHVTPWRPLIGPHLVLEPRVLGELLQLGQLLQVRRPVLTDLLAVNGKDMF